MAFVQGTVCNVVGIINTTWNWKIGLLRRNPTNLPGIKSRPTKMVSSKAEGCPQDLTPYNDFWNYSPVLLSDVGNKHDTSTIEWAAFQNLNGLCNWSLSMPCDLLAHTFFTSTASPTTTVLESLVLTYALWCLVRAILSILFPQSSYFGGVPLVSAQSVLNVVLTPTDLDRLVSSSSF